jgi:hypothetical protein
MPLPPSVSEDLFSSDTPIAVTLSWFWAYAAVTTALALGLGAGVAYVARSVFPTGATRIAVAALVVVVAGVKCEAALNRLASLRRHRKQRLALEEQERHLSAR